MFNLIQVAISSCPAIMKPVVAAVTNPWTHEVTNHIIACVAK